MKIQRPDYDPVFPSTFIKSDNTIDIRKKNLKKVGSTNNQTNWYDDIRTTNFEEENPQSRGYINLPQITGRPSFFDSKLKRTEKESRLMLETMNTALRIRKLDRIGRPVIDNTTGKYIEKTYQFKEILLSSELRAWALAYLTEQQQSGSSYYSQPTYVLMLQILMKQQQTLQPQQQPDQPIGLDATGTVPSVPFNMDESKDPFTGDESKDNAGPDATTITGRAPNVNIGPGGDTRAIGDIPKRITGNVKMPSLNILSPMTIKEIVSNPNYYQSLLTGRTPGANITANYRVMWDRQYRYMALLGYRLNEPIFLHWPSHKLSCIINGSQLKVDISQNSINKDDIIFQPILIKEAGKSSQISIRPIIDSTTRFARLTQPNDELRGQAFLTIKDETRNTLFPTAPAYNLIDQLPNWKAPTNPRLFASLYNKAALQQLIKFFDLTYYRENADVYKARLQHLQTVQGKFNIDRLNLCPVVYWSDSMVGINGYRSGILFKDKKTGKWLVTRSSGDHILISPDQLSKMVATQYLCPIMNPTMIYYLLAPINQSPYHFRCSDNDLRQDLFSIPHPIHGPEFSRRERRRRRKRELQDEKE